MKRSLFCFLAAGVLLSAGMTGLSQPPDMPPRPSGERKWKPPTPEEKEKFRQKIGLTVQQQEQMDALFTESFRQRKELNDRLRELFSRRRKVCDSYDLDRKQEAALRSEIVKVHTQLLKISMDTEEKLRKILNREQFDRLRSLRAEADKTRRNGSRFHGEQGPPHS